ncbi:MAG: ATP-binding cassette domain-containing protein [Clostridium sp.]|nr:ATP-binding cassette domain-containing protein [Acetatifactor muris]MCM1528015.1 ATP-binding cassette domain-containing protein [Bacteroides sp.]MCM1563096.1 ATP-binding cassette domain-containing protein [Clostridium sp.]
MLKISNLTKKYKGVTAVDHFNLEIRSGHIYGIIGPNGAGKTTFFKLLAGLAAPDSGEIIVSTKEPIETFKRKMSFMIEKPYLYEDMTALENIKIIGGIKGETDEENLRQLLELVKIDKTGKKKVKQFSLGMKQRLGIACALASNPEILVLDEPMNGVDPEGIVELRKMLLGLCREKNITLLISGHILGELFQVCSDFVFMKGGQIIDKIDKKTLRNLSLDLEQYYMREIIGNAER